jgi:hypothetical protein
MKAAVDSQYGEILVSQDTGKVPCAQINFGG